VVRVVIQIEQVFPAEVLYWAEVVLQAERVYRAEVASVLVSAVCVSQGMLHQ
jgi:hypothetical protein